MSKLNSRYFHMLFDFAATGVLSKNAVNEQSVVIAAFKLFTPDMLSQVVNSAETRAYYV